MVIEMSDSSTAAGLAGSTPDDGLARGDGDRLALAVAVGLVLVAVGLGVVTVGLGVVTVGLGVGVVSTGLASGVVAAALGVGVGEIPVGLGEEVATADTADAGPEAIRPEAPMAMDAAAASTRGPPAPMARGRRRP